MYNEDEKKGRIESVKEALYSKNADGIFAKKRHSLENKPELKETPSSWAPQDEKSAGKIKIPYTKILIGAFIFFILALGFALYTFFGGSNTVSGNNINILVSGPVSVSGGEVFPLDIKIENNNAVDLQGASMLIQYPDGTRDPNNPATVMTQYSQVLGTISANKNSEQIVKAAIYGQENTQELIKITIEYKIAGSNAIFNKEKDYNLLISSSPINVTVVGDSDVNANQPTNFAVTISSNSLTTVSGLILKVAYPFGFNFISSSLAPTSLDDSVFAIGALAPGASTTINITGSIAGQSGDERVLKFTVGTPSSDGSDIATPFAVYSMDMSIIQPSVGLTLLVNQNSGDEIPIDAGEKNSASIAWQNNLPQAINNMSVKVKFTGAALDQSSINPNDGFYNSADNSVTFDQSMNSDLGTVNPGDEGNMTFDFSTLDPSANPSISFANSQIVMDITASGIPTGGNNTQQTLYSGETVLKISSALNLLSRGFKTVGPFQNSGPLPPKVNSPSTYTITWTATNSFNALSNVQVVSTLPSGVSWTGLISPSTENINYDQTTGQIAWNVGAMPANTGGNIPPRQVSFQVSVTPSLSQVGASIPLLNQATITGTDTYSNENLSATVPAITTDITSDPAYQSNVGDVVQ